jgi:hypothetical protein
MLHRLLAEDRRVFEYWAPQQSVVPISDYRYYIPAMRSRAKSGRAKDWLEAHRDVVEHVLTRIREEGPLGAADFKAPPDWDGGTWWDWKPAKRALERLNDIGELMVTERRNFQRIFDLAERVLPPDVNTTPPTREEWLRWRARRALRMPGIIGMHDAAKWGNKTQREALQAIWADLVAEGEAYAVEVAGEEGRTHYVSAKLLDRADEARLPSGLCVLSPFDPIVSHRRRTEALFDFDFRLEAYTPKAKRQYGYYVLPLLHGDRFVGRVDCKAHRDEGVLAVRGLWLEEGVEVSEGLLADLADELWAFAAFNECHAVDIQAAESADLRERLARAVGAASEDTR